MKTIMVFPFSWFMALAVFGHVYGGDYYVYQDRNGKLVISNNAPPPGSKILARVPSVVEKEKGVFSRYRKTETGSWGESDRGGIRL